MSPVCGGVVRVVLGWKFAGGVGGGAAVQGKGGYKGGPATMPLQQLLDAKGGKGGKGGTGALPNFIRNPSATTPPPPPPTTTTHQRQH